MPTRPFPVEIYVAVFGIRESIRGFIIFHPASFPCGGLRDGVATLLQIKKGRPDLEFLKTLPAVIFVAVNYWPAIYRFGRRGYRTMLLDAGQMVQNLVISGAGLGRADDHAPEAERFGDARINRLRTG